MQVQPVAFAGSGIAESASAGTPEQVVGLSFKGFTAVIVHNGHDVTGDVVANCTSAGVFSWNYELYCQNGLYLECTGSGSGTVWLV